jgi:hypothetical protein
MDFTDTQRDLIVNAWILARSGRGMVITNDAYPDAHRLAEAGWLTRQFVGPDREMAWFWSREAEAALDMTQLMQGAEGREN